MAHGVVAGRACIVLYFVNINSRCCAQESQVIHITCKKQEEKISKLISDFS